MSLINMSLINMSLINMSLINMSLINMSLRSLMINLRLRTSEALSSSPKITANCSQAAS